MYQFIQVNKPTPTMPAIFSDKSVAFHANTLHLTIKLSPDSWYIIMCATVDAYTQRG